MFNHTAYAQDSMWDDDFIPDFLCTLYAVMEYGCQYVWRLEQPFQSICQGEGASINKIGIFQPYYYLQLAHTLNYILNK